MHAAASKTSRLVEREVQTTTTVVEEVETITLELSPKAAMYLRTAAYALWMCNRTPSMYATGIPEGKECMKEIYDALRHNSIAKPAGGGWQNYIEQ